jgi:hypothetical protein
MRRRLLNEEKRPRTSDPVSGNFLTKLGNSRTSIIKKGRSARTHGCPHGPDDRGQRNQAYCITPTLITDVAVGARPHWSFGSTLIPGESTPRVHAYAVGCTERYKKVYATHLLSIFPHLMRLVESFAPHIRTLGHAV